MRGLCEGPAGAIMVLERSWLVPKALSGSLVLPAQRYTLELDTLHREPWWCRMSGIPIHFDGLPREGVWMSWMDGRHLAPILSPFTLAIAAFSNSY